MSDEIGITGTKAVLVAVNALALEIIKVMKDGAQFQDILTVMSDVQNNPDLKKALEDAYANVKAVPAEVKDISLAESLELLSTQVAFVPQIVSALKA